MKLVKYEVNDKTKMFGTVGAVAAGTLIANSHPYVGIVGAILAYTLVMGITLRTGD